MKKIILAVDYNQFAQKVVETGFAYSRLMKAEMIIVHAIPEISYGSTESESIMGFQGFSTDGAFMNMEEQKEEANKFLGCIVKHLGDMSIKTRVLHYKNPSETILAYAVKSKADLIVIGMHSPYEYPAISFGINVTSDLVNQSPIPVLVVPPKQYETNIPMGNRRNYFYA